MMPSVPTPGTKIVRCKYSANVKEALDEVQVATKATELPERRFKAYVDNSEVCHDELTNLWRDNKDLERSQAEAERNIHAADRRAKKAEAERNYLARCFKHVNVFKISQTTKFSAFFFMFSKILSWPGLHHSLAFPSPTTVVKLFTVRIFTNSFRKIRQSSTSSTSSPSTSAPSF